MQEGQRLEVVFETNMRTCMNEKVVRQSEPPPLAPSVKEERGEGY